MKSSYQSVETVLEYLEANGVLGPATSALLAMLLTGGVILLGVWFYLSYKKFRVRGGLSGVRTRKKVKTLRARGQLEGEFTFADAIEMTETGTVRRKTLENKIVDCVVPVEMLFSSDDHGLIYQFQMGEWSEKDVASWFEVANALNLADLSRIIEEVMLMRDVICHPEYDPETKLGDGKKLATSCGVGRLNCVSRLTRLTALLGLGLHAKPTCDKTRPICCRFRPGSLNQCFFGLQSRRMLTAQHPPLWAATRH